MNELEAISEQRERARQPQKTASAGSFMIRDREFEDHDFGHDEDYETRIDEEFEALTSRAERELASALKRRRRYDA